MIRVGALDKQEVDCEVVTSFWFSLCNLRVLCASVVNVS